VNAWAPRLWLGAALLSSAAFGWPVDRVVDVEKGKERFEQATSVDWVDVENPGVADVERLEGGELLVTGKAAGATLVLLHAQGIAAVWRVRVYERAAPGKPALPAALLEAARKACPGLNLQGAALSAVIKDAACRKAMLTLLESDALGPSDLDLTLDLPALQAQLKAIADAFAKAGIPGTPQYQGATLVLDAELTVAQAQRALWATFRQTLGRPTLEQKATHF